MDILLKYFPDLSEKQIRLFEQLKGLYEDWNAKINLISRKDMDNLYERHVLHSLAIAKIINFKPLTKVMDLGTGGGFPGLPLSIMFPETRFYLIDSIGKKIKVVQELIKSLGINNAEAAQIRAEELDEEFDFVVNRAVAPLETLCYWTKDKFSKNSFHDLKNGMLCLKGGEVEEEIKKIDKKCKVWLLSDYFEEEFFETKKVVYVPMG